MFTALAAKSRDSLQMIDSTIVKAHRAAAGARLHRAFVDAGLPPPAMRMQSVIGDTVGAAEWLRAMAELATVVAPTVEERGVVTAAEIGIGTLSNRLIQEVAVGGGIVVGRADIGAWVRTKIWSGVPALLGTRFRLTVVVGLQNKPMAA
jgi:hypothetical protein